MIHPEPIGTPALGVMMIGFLAFIVALASARGRASGGERVAENRSSRSTIGIGIQMIGFAAVGIGPVLPTLPSASPLAIGEATAVAALMGLTILLFVAATRAMGRNWSIVARTREDHALVTAGPFRFVRHPIYSALFAFLLAMAVALGHWRGLILGVPLYWIGTWIRIAEEERLLRAQFGAAYDAYAARVKRFVPGVI